MGTPQLSVSGCRWAGRQSKSKAGLDRESGEAEKVKHDRRLWAYIKVDKEKFQVVGYGRRRLSGLAGLGGARGIEMCKHTKEGRDWAVARSLHVAPGTKRSPPP